MSVVSQFVEIMDQAEIMRHNSSLQRDMRKHFPYRKKRRIGWPSGQMEVDVHFQSKADNSLWWHGDHLDDRGLWLNLFGRGDYPAGDMLNIDLQFNFSSDAANRRTGGAFVFDRESSNVVLAHRGLVTRGKSRVPKARLMAEADVLVETVACPDNKVRELMLVGPIGSAGFEALVADFTTRVRTAADRVASKVSAGKANEKGGGGVYDRLTEFFDEFMGSATIPARGSRQAVWKHGAIVSALRHELASATEIEKSQKIDLLASFKKTKLLFEVKTKPDLQSVYAAIGQLLLHSCWLAQEYPKTDIVKVLVAPISPPKRAQEYLESIGINLVTWRSRRGRGYEFNGLRRIIP